MDALDESKVQEDVFDTNDDWNPQEHQIAFYDTGKRGTLILPRASCGHKFSPGCPPRHRNCSLCWFTYFQTTGGITQVAEEVFATHGERALVQIKGRKFTNHFKNFMGAVAAYKLMIEEQDEHSTGRTEGSSEDSEIGSQSGEVDGEIDGSYYGDFK